ncbi:hypothetical protein CSB45_01670 [candidate division KSB3 bacterium]|uniref:Membrane protein 6-pyruvoyl-tetrahydropterin synthase-related domain-containing protein n=1 Tax=candidate division KSB3 bacterium TaxID=2044937 RepID=A0A2G6EB02_9BACT|nr:MAG: hypothetical protein CSB45_01670 [candidate division KSB3 bacterium]PIE30701.1 MAG: hypothetical protein CSA57_01680 [candidate division KSB3 bacterium]
MTQRTRFKEIFQEKEFWFLILLWIGFCFRPLFLDETFFFRDVTYFFFPQEKLFADLLRAGEFPLWDAYRHGGHPYLADLNNSPLYPANLLFLFLPAVKAFSLFVVLHYILCSLSAYLFSRSLGLQKTSSFLVGVFYGFCGYSLSLNDHPTRLAAMGLLPLILLYWHLFLSERRRRYFVSASLVAVLQVILGAPEVNVLMMVTLLGWAVTFPFPNVSVFRKLMFWGLLAGSIIGGACFQVLPTLEAVSQSSRGIGLDYRMFAQWSLYPGRIPEMFVPAFRGYLDRLPYNIYFWGGDLGDYGYPYIPNIYFGCVAFALAVIGACSPQRQPCPLRSRLFLAGMFFVSLILAFGRFVPFFPLLFRVVPLISIFRYPIKFLLGGIFPLAFLAGYGAEMILTQIVTTASPDPAGSKRRRKARNILIALWSVVFLLGSFTLLFWLSSDFAVQLQSVFFTRPGTAISHAGLSRSFTHATAVWLLFTLLVTSRYMQPRAWQSWAFAVVLVVDLLSAGRRVSPVAPAAYFNKEPALAERIRQEIGDGRLYRSPDALPQFFHFPVGGEFMVPPDHIMWLYRWQLETLRFYLGGNYHIPVIFHRDYNMMAQRRIIRLKELIEALPWDRKIPLLSSGGVTLVLSSDNIDVPGLERVAAIPNWSDRPLLLYRNTRAAPRVGFVTQWQDVESDREAERWMLKADFDPRRHVVLQEPQKTVFFRIADFGRARALEPPADPNSCENPLDVRIETKAHSSQSASYAVTNNCSGYLVFTEQLYPGWHIEIDGKAATLKLANLAFSAVWLEAGSHEVWRGYSPRIVWLGIVCSILTCGLFLLLMLRKLI